MVAAASGESSGTSGASVAHARGTGAPLAEQAHRSRNRRTALVGTALLVARVDRGATSMQCSPWTPRGCLPVAERTGRFGAALRN